MTFLSFPTTPETAILPACSVDARAQVSCSTALSQSVGVVLPDPIRAAEDELDRVIKELGYQAVHAKAAKDHAGARELTDRMMAAIRSRTPEHQERLAAEARARIDADPCYFSAMGEMAAARVSR